MPLYIAAYDLKDNRLLNEHEAFREAALNNGWFLWILGTNGFKYRLPNTTLDGEFPSYQAAWNALDRTARQAQAKVGRIVVEKWVITEYTTAHFDSDQKLPG